MFKLAVLGLLVAYMVAESSSQGFRVILPTYRPPPTQQPVIRTVRDLNSENYLQENSQVRATRSLDSPDAKRGGGGGGGTSGGSRDTGHTHPGYNRRNARSVDEPLWLYQGDDVIGAPAPGDHPGGVIDDIHLDPNRRYARSLSTPGVSRSHGGHTPSSSTNTGPTHPGYNRRNARSPRYQPMPSDIWPRPDRRTFPTFPRPGNYPILARHARDLNEMLRHRPVIIPNWNPNVRTNPWQRIGGRKH